MALLKVKIFNTSATRMLAPSYTILSLQAGSLQTDQQPQMNISQFRNLLMAKRGVRVVIIEDDFIAECRMRLLKRIPSSDPIGNKTIQELFLIFFHIPPSS